MIDALPRNATILLTKNCPQKPAKIETEVRYNAAKKHKQTGYSYYIHVTSNKITSSQTEKS